MLVSVRESATILRKASRVQYDLDVDEENTAEDGQTLLPSGHKEFNFMAFDAQCFANGGQLEVMGHSPM